MIPDKLHRFVSDVSTIELPTEFTYPFHYTPHPLCVAAAGEVEQHIERMQGDLRAELDEGKMLGVLVARTSSGALGYLVAYSGNLGHSGQHDYFVPAVYDLLNPDGEFKRGERAITALNHRIEAMEQSPELQALQARLRAEQAASDLEINNYRVIMARSKALREQSRSAGGLTDDEQARLVAESQFQKAELKRMRRRAEERLSATRSAIAIHTSAIAELKRQRKSDSESLQRRIFSLFRVDNARGESEDLWNIFNRQENRVPPAGAGECAAPKLLQYALSHHLEPLCMGEFWWGKSPRRQVRHQGHFYGACTGKCRPILNFMMQGLRVEANPLERVAAMPHVELNDEWLMVVNKPAGMLSQPGKVAAPSLVDALSTMFPDEDTLLVVHRLDMATSGLVLIAKSLDVYRALQQQFAKREVHKTYIADMQGALEADSGVITLPLRPDIDDRPRQVVDFELGKPAETHYTVLSRSHGVTRVQFQPITGRTHQLRVHAAHPFGLNAPIVGDALYGHAADRLHLHAQSITFTHPITNQQITITSKIPF